MELKERVAVVAITAEGGGLARRIADALGDAEVHGLRERAGDADVWFTDTTRHVRELFEAGRPVVGVCAAGILVRSVAPAPRGQARGAARRRRLRRRGVRGAPPRGAPGRGRAGPVHRECDRRDGRGHHRRRPALRHRPRRAARRLDPREPRGRQALRRGPPPGARVRPPAGIRGSTESRLPIADSVQGASHAGGGSDGGATATAEVPLAGGEPTPLRRRGRARDPGRRCEGRWLSRHPRLPPAPARGRNRLRAGRGAGRDRDPRPLVPRRGRPCARSGRRGVLDRPQVGRARGSRPRRIPRRAGPVPSRPCPGGGGAAAPEPLGPRVPPRSAATGSRRARPSRRRGRRASSSSRRPSRCAEPAPSPAPRHRSMHPRSARPAASWRWSGSAPVMPAP